MIGKTVWMLIICWNLEGAHPKEAWRIQQPATVEICAQMSSIFATVGSAAAIIVRCNPWYLMAPVEDWRK